MQIVIEVGPAIAAQARARGIPVEAYVERLIEKAAQAVAHLREARKGVTLGGLKIKDLIHKGHKY